MIKYIHHISDIHIRILKRHSEFRGVFSNLYAKIKERSENSLIVLTGDIVHSKLEMSPELVALVSEFFTELAKITKVLIIPGNHDCNLNNSTRLDAITPIVDALQNPNIIYSKTTNNVTIDNINFLHYSILDSNDTYDALKRMKTCTNIGLYHGVVNGASMNGIVLDDGVSLRMFDGLDAVMLGDIHISQQMQAKKKGIPEVWYAGSLIQNNYGEDDDKGYLLWDVDTLTPEFIKIHSDYGYHTLVVDNGEYTLPTVISKKPRIRLKISNTVISDVHKISADLRSMYDVQEIIINNVDRDISLSKKNGVHTLFNLRDINQQNKLIKEYVQTRMGVDDPSILERIYSINSEMNNELKPSDTTTNISWIPKKFEFSNMFSYGEGNVVDFSKLNGVVGLFAPNASGKSSLIDALMFCIFDKSSRAYKGINILNSRKKTFHCKFNFEIDGVDYWIERHGTKGKGDSVKVNVDFWTVGDDGQILSLNGKAREETNQNIRGYIGTYEDFITTAMSFQGNNNSFIEKTQTERKDFLAKFLDIGVFDELHDIANERTKEVSVLLKEYAKQDFGSRLSDLNDKLNTYTLNLNAAVLERDKFDEEERTLNEQCVDIAGKKMQIPSGVIDIDNVKRMLQQYTEAELELKDRIVKQEDVIVQYKTDAVNTYYEVQKLKDSGVEDKYQKLLSCTTSYNLAISKRDMQKQKVDQMVATLKDLEKHEYDPNCKYCINNVFVKKAIETKERLVAETDMLSQLQSDVDTISMDMNLLESVKSEYDTYQRLSKSLDIKKMDALKSENDKKTLEQRLSDTINNIEKLNNKVTEYESTKVAVQHNMKLDSELVGIKQLLALATKNKKEKDAECRSYQVQREVVISEIAKINDTISNAKDMEEKFKAYELYTKSVHRDGVPYELISTTIPTLQEEVNDILAQIVDFNILFNLDGKNVNAFIAYDDDKFWSLEMVSGMEKFIGSLAIRCALLNICNLSRPTFLAIDEGFGVLDSDNISSLNYLFDYLKQKFEFVLIVSHIDSMKDAVDFVLDISKDNGFSMIKHE